MFSDGRDKGAVLRSGRVLRAGLALAGLACAVPVMAQSTAPALPAQGVMVTVEGCVSKADPAAQLPVRTGTAADVQYVLTAPASSEPPARTPETSSGATAAGFPKPARKMYILSPASGVSVDLARHLSHTVRVTGATTAPLTTDPLGGRSPEATPRPGTTAPPGSTGSLYDTTNLPTLAVTSLTLVATSCR